MKLADLGNFNLLNGVTTIGAIVVADGVSSFLSSTSGKNSVQRREYYTENAYKLVSGSIALFLGTRFSVSINDFPRVVHPLLLRNLQIILSCGGSGALILGLKDILTGRETGLKSGLAQIAVGAAALNARLGSN